MLRSFAEHRAGLATSGRAATVERGGLFALLYLNNNLHAAHHDKPGLPWHRLPAHHRALRLQLTNAGAVSYPSYGAVIRRFAFRPHDDMVHPDFREAAP